jgi:hypothetical protein
MQVSHSPWNSLEVAKLIAAGATPIFILFLGLLVQRVARRIEAVQWANRKVIEKRLEIYDSIAPLLNDLLCYFAYVGNWKELTPAQLVASKRLLDRKVHLASPLFSPTFLERYNDFVQLCFRTYNAMGEDAKLRTSPDNRRTYSRESWQGDWDRMFVSSADRSDPREIVQGYDELMACFSKELGLGLEPPPRLFRRSTLKTISIESEWRRLAKQVKRALPWRDAPDAGS